MFTYNGLTRVKTAIPSLTFTLELQIFSSVSSTKAETCMFSSRSFWWKGEEIGQALLWLAALPTLKFNRFTFINKLYDEGQNDFI